MKTQAMLVEVVLPEKRDADGLVSRTERVLYESEKPERLTDVQARRDNILNRESIRELVAKVEDATELVVRVFVFPFVNAM